MKIQIRRFEVKSGSPDAICQEAAQGVPTILKQISGFIDYYVVNGKDNFVFSVTIFQDQTGLDQAYQKVKEWTQKMTQGNLSESQVFQGEVIYSASQAERKAA